MSCNIARLLVNPKTTNFGVLIVMNGPNTFNYLFSMLGMLHFEKVMCRAISELQWHVL